MSLIAQYLFNGNANDSSKNGYNGTATGVTWESQPTTQYFNSGVVKFAGAQNSYITLPDALGNKLTGDVTYEFWTNIISYVFPQADFFEFGVTRGFFWNDNNQYRVYMGYHGLSDQAQYAYLTISNPANSGWLYYAMVYSFSTSTLNLYQNGKLVASNQFTSNSSALTPCYFGRTYNYNGYPARLNGRLANFRVYDEALSATTIASHYAVESQPGKPWTDNFLQLGGRRLRSPHEVSGVYSLS